MEPNNPMTTGPMPQPQSPMPPQPPKSESTSGSMMAVIVIVALLIVGALYFWMERAEDDASEAAANAELQEINTQSSSDAEADIEADLNTTDVEGVDYDLNEENFNAS